MFSVSLYKLCDASAAAAFARENGAIAHGLISVAGVPRAPSRPIMWMRSRQRLAVIVAEQRREIGDDLLRAMARLLRTFFRDVRRVAPGLADFLMRGCQHRFKRSQDFGGLERLFEERPP